METSLCIIKPNAIKKNVIGNIIGKFEANSLKVIGLKLVHYKKEVWEKFYLEHKEKSFYSEVTEFMAQSPVVIMALKGESAIQKCRDIMGATNPQNAAPNTIRALYGDNVGENAVHGSDSSQSAERELNLLFDKSELY